ncbi:3D domain-containing protein [Paenibacillus glycanilyticus]|uniref:3D domain-containing protein n=1 Tax=Paenibacillus glycanilyticus TaxID=126569 RepID=UPI0037CA9829
MAVDTDVIALGTALDIRIENNEGTTEIIHAVAADTGGSIRGKRIDVLMATEAEAIEFGRRDVQVRIIKR